jgi:hypothetical protein
MLTLQGRSARLTYAEGRLRAYHPDRGEPVLDVLAREILKVIWAWIDDDTVAGFVLFTSPDVLVEGRPAHWGGYEVIIDAAQSDAADLLTAAIYDDLIEARRVAVPGPDLTPPETVQTANGPYRADVAAAAGRMSYTRESGHAITAMHAYARPDEYVLELAEVSYKGREGLLALTTVRFMFIAIGRAGGVAYEFPLAGVTGGRAVDDAAGNPVDIIVNDGFNGYRFTRGHHADVARMATAVQFAVSVDRAGGLGPAAPSSAELFDAWQLLMERRALGMVDDEEFQRTGRGILFSFS